MKVLITGGSKGLGKEIKDRLIDHEVIDFSRSSGIDLTKEIPSFECDILILNAGVWKNNWRLNYEVPKEMSERMPKDKLVIFVLSNAAYQSYGNDDYTTSKCGLLYYLRRKQREGYGFASISPGTINTGFWDKADIDNRKKECMDPKDVAESVYHIIKQFEKKVLIKEMILNAC
jgi:short-subunit dehydrogenase